jgi:hypothetical protein
VRKLAIVIALCISAGCANFNCNNAEKIGATWIGASVDEVSSSPVWGFPAEESVVMERKRVTWHYGFTDYDWGCNRIFGLGPDGKIQNSQWSGACDTHFERWAKKGAVCN